MSRHRSRYMKQILLISLPFLAAVASVDAQESFISPDKVFEAYTTSDTRNVILRLRPTGLTSANNIAILWGYFGERDHSFWLHTKCSVVSRFPLYCCNHTSPKPCTLYLSDCPRW